jgi:hypothetical protein
MRSIGARKVILVLDLILLEERTVGLISGRNHARDRVELECLEVTEARKTPRVKKAPTETIRPSLSICWKRYINGQHRLRQVI